MKRTGISIKSKGRDADGRLLVDINEHKYELYEGIMTLNLSVIWSEEADGSFNDVGHEERLIKMFNRSKSGQTRDFIANILDNPQQFKFINP
jgi:hypothetical protein